MRDDPRLKLALMEIELEEELLFRTEDRLLKYAQSILVRFTVHCLNIILRQRAITDQDFARRQAEIMSLRAEIERLREVDWKARHSATVESYKTEFTKISYQLDDEEGKNEVLRQELAEAKESADQVRKEFIQYRKKQTEVEDKLEAQLSEITWKHDRLKAKLASMDPKLSSSSTERVSRETKASPVPEDEVVSSPIAEQVTVTVPVTHTEVVSCAIEQVSTAIPASQGPSEASNSVVQVQPERKVPVTQEVKTGPVDPWDEYKAVFVLDRTLFKPEKAEMINDIIALTIVDKESQVSKKILVDTMAVRPGGTNYYKAKVSLLLKEILREDVPRGGNIQGLRMR